MNTIEWQPADIEGKLGLEFKHPETLFLALSHPSYAKLAGNLLATNERLELLGTAILELAIASYLYHYCPYLKVANWRGLLPKLTENERLTKFWFQLGLGTRYPFLDLNEERATLRQKPNNPFASATRALVGAIHCDRGFTQARNWLYKNLIAPVLAKHLKQTTERAEPAPQLRFVGHSLLLAVTVDYLYHRLPNVTPSELQYFQRYLTTKQQQKTYQTLSLTAGNADQQPFEEWLASYYYQGSETSDRAAFRQTQTWFVEHCIDEEELLRQAIERLRSQGIPQKWIIREVLGYASKDYHAGRDRYYEILDETASSEEE